MGRAAAALLPAGLIAVAACATAWFDSGSIEARSWLPYAILAGLCGLTVLLAGAAVPGRLAGAGLGLLFGLAAWAALSAAWSPVPALARDEALLTAFFALGVAVPILSARRPETRIAGLWLVALVIGAFCLICAATIAFGGRPLSRFYEGRLYFPVTYANAQAGMFFAGFWPAVVLAARRASAVWLRALALGLAAGAAGAALLAQSKGSLLGLLASLVVVAVVSPARLRLLLAALLALALPVAAARPLTAPFRSPTDPTTARHAGVAVLAIAVAGAALGAAYAFADRRLDLTARRETVARATAVAAIAVTLVASAAFVATQGSPATWLGDRWTTFKSYHPESGSTHLSNLGSYRYDFWRRSLVLFREHPLAGCGARCFAVEYLLDRKSPERPRRAHSLPLDTAAEQGAVGLALLAGGFGLLLVAVGKGARARRAPAIAALAGTTAFLGQCAVDWNWTFPAASLPYALLLGFGAADGARGLLDARSARTGAGIAGALVVLGFAPVWLSSRLTTDALRGSPHVRGDLAWAHRLDPLSTAPLIGEALTARNTDEQLAALRAAVRREPRVVEPRYFLGVALLNLGRKAEARRELRRALAADPGNVSVTLALAQATQTSGKA